VHFLCQSKNWSRRAIQNSGIEARPCSLMVRSGCLSDVDALRSLRSLRVNLPSSFCAANLPCRQGNPQTTGAAFPSAGTNRQNASTVLLPLARELTAKRHRRRIATSLFRLVGMAHNKLLKGCHNLAALQPRRRAVHFLFAKCTLPKKAACEGAGDDLGDHPHAGVLCLSRPIAALARMCPGHRLGPQRRSALRQRRRWRHCTICSCRLIMRE
jgi:hypothetical protein